MKLKVKNYLYRAILDSQKRKIKRKKKLLLSQNIVNNHKKLQFHNLGNKNPKKIFYIIQRKKGGGLFSNLLFVLNHLAICEKLKLIPIVDMYNFEGFYNEINKVNKTLNSWEYYFNQTSKYKLEDVYQSKNVIFSSSETFKNYKLRAFKKFKDLYNAYKKYIRMNTAIIKEANENFKRLKIDRYNTVGLHWRGTDHKFLPNHPQPPSRKQIFNKIDKILKNKKRKKIFLVTEDPEYLEIMKKKYGKKVLYLNSFRSSKSSDFSNFNRNNHRFKVGKESLIEVLILSKLNYLVCSESNISDFAKFISLNKNFYIDRIVNTRNSSNVFISFLRWKIKSFLPSFLGGY